ncbi:MAG: ABC transporter permease [Pseudomonadota bacterium]|nr:ABC transporter permease [Pseudomonadota bacterium]
MNMGDINLSLLFASLIVAATPVLLAALGELIVEKTGVLNLGVEGMMIFGAITGFIATIETGSPWLGFLFSILGGISLAFIFAIVTQVFRANQVASGLALTLFGLGLSSLLGYSYTGIKPAAFPDMHVPYLSELPFLGIILFQHDPIIYFSIFAVFSVYLLFRNSRLGLILKAVGENHDSAHALGYNVILIRFLTILVGGAFAGLGGGYLSLVRVPQWTEGMTAGAGWIALALVVFASWQPFRLLVGAYIFGGVTLLQLNLQALGVEINVALLSMSPYLVTIAVLVFMSARRAKGSLEAPRSLGKTFFGL